MKVRFAANHDDRTRKAVLAQRDSGRCTAVARPHDDDVSLHRQLSGAI